MWRGGFAWTILILTLVTFLTNQGETRLVARQDSGTPTTPTSSSTSTSTTPSTSPSSSATPILNFDNDNVLQPFTCQAVDIRWSYSGPRANINLYVTNIGVSQSVPAPRVSISDVRAAASPSPATDKTNLRNVTIATKLDPSVRHFSWSSVNVPQGWYVINATMPAQSYATGSSPFYVYTGINISCISSGSTSKSSTASSLRTPTPYQSNVATGVAVGVSLGAFGVIAAMVMACVWLKRRKNKRSFRRHPRSHYIHSPHWKGFGSADSQGALRGDNPKTCHVPHNDSIGTVHHLTQSEEAAAAAAEKSSIHSKIDSVSCEQDVTLSSLPVLRQQSSRTRPFTIDRSNSLSSSTTHGFSNDHSTTPERRPSGRKAVSARRSFDSIAYPPTASTAHLSMPPSTTSHDQSPSPVNSPARPQSYAPADVSKLAHRQSLGRKRKPVPAYDAEELASPPAPPVPASTSPVSPSASPFDVSLASSRPTSSNAGHYVIRDQSSQEFGRPELSHKGSFGPGKPMHYLIPDMPLPQQK